MQFHFMHRRADARVAQEQLKLGNRHIRNADVPHQPPVHQIFHGAPGAQEFLVDVGPESGLRAFPSQPGG